MKYITFSFDDGLEQDKKIIEILKTYGLFGATFNLNSGMLGTDGYVGRIGDLAFIATKPGKKPKDGMLKYTPSFRIPSDEIVQVYNDFEIAAHGCQHLTTISLSEAELHQEILGDIVALKKLTGKEVVGMAYAGGMNNKRVRKYLKEQGVEYARTVSSDTSFGYPKDPLKWAATCSFPSSKLFDLFHTFIHTQTDKDQLFYVWGHGYEFDFGSPQCNWNKLRRFCELVASHPEIKNCTNHDALMSRKV